MRVDQLGEAMKPAVYIILGVLVLFALMFGVVWGFKMFATTVNNAAVQHKVIEVEGRRYLVVVSSDGVAVCPLVAP